MQPASAPLDSWPRTVSHLSSLMDLEASARSHRALLRKRGVRSAADLLHLALLYGPGGMSLRALASHATETGIADLCDVSLLDRLRNAPDFLNDVLRHLLAERLGAAPQSGELRLCMVDGSTISAPGSAGCDWRLHARYESGCGGFTDFDLTPIRDAEALNRVILRPGDVALCDRGFARLRNFADAQANQADFITRIGWCSLRLFNLAGERFNLLAALAEAGQRVVDHRVRIGSGTAAVEARLILAPKPAEAAARQQNRAQRRANRSGNKTDPRTLLAAGFMMLVTSLPAPRANAEQVLALYRMRWQIELAFKRLKSLGRFAELRADDAKLARAWLLAHLIAAVLIETSLGEDLDSPP